MNREQISRTDFPPSEVGYDRPSVDAHLAAVAALTAALEAQVKALEVERDALRRQLEDVPSGPPNVSSHEPVAPGGVDVTVVKEAVRDVPGPVEAGPDEFKPAGSGPDGSGPGEPEPDAGGSGTAQPAQSDDEVSARVVATQLALEGVDREQIREKLEVTYDLEDADSLIDDVLERLA